MWLYRLLQAQVSRHPNRLERLLNMLLCLVIATTTQERLDFVDTTRKKKY